MCGIVGYIGEEEAIGLILDSLRRLEYRGYDSAGVATISENKIEIKKTVGKLIELEKLILKEPLSGNIGIGHTRWATHGKPSFANAHPHLDCLSQIALVHNGIIENYSYLKEDLINRGHKFSSQTDTEVIVHLLEEFSKDNSLEEALIETCKLLKGSYAIVAISLNNKEEIVAARCGSPLILGINSKVGNFLASDIPALLPYTRNIIPLEERELAIIRKRDFTIISFDDKSKIIRSPQYITWDPATAEKSGYKHFMLKEIHEQSRTFRETLMGRIDEDKKINLKEELNEGLIDKLRNIKEIFIVACGTAYFAASVAKFWLENLVKLRCEVDIASEFRYRKPILKDSTLLIAVSQSGETADTLASVNKAKEEGIATIGICNVLGSSLTRIVDSTIYLRAGPEIGVASTKAFTGQLAALLLFSLFLADLHKKGDNLTPLVEEFTTLDNLIEELLAREDEYKELARHYFKYQNFLYLARGINYPIAQEGALKLKEISYIHAESYPAGEMKHGPIALIEENMPTVVIAPNIAKETYPKILANIEEVKARDGKIIAIGNFGDDKLEKLVDDLILVPPTHELLSPFINVIPLQLFAYHVALRRGCDIDQPRNLAKSVTVE